MFKSKILAIFLAFGLIGISLPFPAFAFAPAPVSGLPAGVHFELKTEENGISIFATVHCVNTTTSSLYIKIVGGVISVVNPNIRPEIYPASAYAESKIPEGAYDVPAHSKVVVTHLTLPMRAVRMGTDGMVQPLSVMPMTNWIVRAELKVIPIHYSSPMTMQVVDGNTIEAAAMVQSEQASLEDPVRCLGYPVCYENMPMRIVVEDTVQMDYRWRQLDIIMNDVKNVGSNVVSTNATVNALETQMKINSKPVVKSNSRPTR